MDYGTDLKLDDNRDIVFTLSGDVKTVSGAALVAQDVREELSLYLGSVFYDRTAGSTILDHLNSNEELDITIMNELERVAFRDKRIDASSIEASRTAEGKYRLVFSVIGYVDEQELLFDLADILGESDA